MDSTALDAPHRRIDYIPHLLRLTHLPRGPHPPDNARSTVERIQHRFSYRS
jgi:hypothetical protein